MLRAWGKLYMKRERGALNVRYDVGTMFKGFHSIFDILTADIMLYLWYVNTRTLFELIAFSVLLFVNGSI